MPTNCLRGLLGCILLFFGLPVLALAQTDTVFYAVRGNQVDTKAASRTYAVNVYDPADTTKGMWRSYLTRGDRLLQEIPYSGYVHVVRHGQERAWDSAGALVLEQRYQMGRPHGDFKTFYPNGALKRHEVYDQGKRISGTCYGQAGKEVPFFEYYVSPRPHKRINLQQYLSNRISYTRRMKREGAQGLLQVSFIVNRTGDVSYVKIEKGLHPELDKQVEEAFNNLPQGKPGYIDGKPHPVKVLVPIYFSNTGSTLSNGVLAGVAQLGMNTVGLFLGALSLPVVIGRSTVHIRSRSYHLDGAANYYEEPIYGPRP